MMAARSPATCGARAPPTGDFQDAREHTGFCSAQKSGSKARVRIYLQLALEAG